jgi:hypothetical protein
MEGKKWEDVDCIPGILRLAVQRESSPSFLTPTEQADLIIFYPQFFTRLSGVGGAPFSLIWWRVAIGEESARFRGTRRHSHETSTLAEETDLQF